MARNTSKPPNPIPPGYKWDPDYKQLVRSPTPDERNLSNIGTEKVSEVQVYPPSPFNYPRANWDEQYGNDHGPFVPTPEMQNDANDADEYMMPTTGYYNKNDQGGRTLTQGPFKKSVSLKKGEDYQREDVYHYPKNRTPGTKSDIDSRLKDRKIKAGELAEGDETNYPIANHWPESPKNPKKGPFNPNTKSPFTSLSSAIAGKLARPNRYTVLITMPPILSASMKNGSYMKYADDFVKQNISKPDNRLHLTCEAASLPGHSVQTKDIRTYGPIRKFAFDQSFSDISLTFMVGEDMLEKKIFEVWHQSIFDVSTHNMNYYKEYVAPIHIFQQNRKDKVTYAIELYEAYPMTISDLSLSYAENDSYHKLSVTFAYRKWQEVTSESGGFDTQVKTSQSLHGVSNIGNNDTSKTAPPGMHWDLHTGTLQPNS